MITKKEDCVLIFIPVTMENGTLIRELVKSGKRVRVVLEHLKLGKKNLFDILEKLDGVYELPKNSNWNQKMNEITKVKNGVAPNIVLILSTGSAEYTTLNTDPYDIKDKLDCKQFDINVKIINYFKSSYQLSLKKFIFVNIDQKSSSVKFKPGSFDLNACLSYQTEKLIKDSHLNYLILRTTQLNNDKTNYGMNLETFRNIIFLIFKGEIFKNNAVVDFGKDYFLQNKNSLFYTLKFFPQDIYILHNYFKMHNNFNSSNSSNSNNSRTTSIINSKHYREDITFKVFHHAFIAGVTLKFASFLWKKLVWPF
jgi:hypothetical protein